MPNPTISFETIAAPGSTPISLNAASAKSFANNYYKAGAPNISENDRKQIRVLSLVYELAAAGGTNYKNNIQGLINDSQVYTGAISNFDLDVAMCALDWNGGKAADATLSGDIPTLLAIARLSDSLTEQRFARMIAFLRAQLGK